DHRHRAGGADPPSHRRDRADRAPRVVVARRSRQRRARGGPRHPASAVPAGPAAADPPDPAPDRLRAAVIPLLALVLDLAFGEPPNRLHPVAWVGRLLALGFRTPRRAGPARLLIQGSAVVV